jgi:hypothetical protein
VKNVTIHRVIRSIASGVCGYKIDADNGIIIGPRGIRKIKCYGKQRYPAISVRLALRGQMVRVFTVPVHKLIGYIKFGEAAFGRGIHVRHKDGDSMNFKSSNLLIGTASQNEMDKPLEARTRAASMARQAQGESSWNRIFSTEEVNAIRAEIKGGERGTSSRIARRHGVSKSTISSIARGVR